MYCKLCPKKMNYQGNTTNMMVHLQYNHRAEFLKVKNKANSATQAQSASQRSSKQPSITESMKLLQPIPQSSKKWKTLTKCYYVAKDMMPFSTELQCSENPLQWWHDHKRHFLHGKQIPLCSCHLCSFREGFQYDRVYC